MFPRELKHFSPVREIGRGGLSDIYVALDCCQQRVLVRLLKEEYLGQRRVRNRFINGGRILAQLQHPHIARLVEEGTVQSRPYTVTEFLDAHSLRDLMRQDHPLLAHHPLPIITQMAECLHYIHTQGFLHLDFKPENILLDERPHVTLIDFDLAVRRRDRPVKVREASGTPAYMAPELLHGHTADIPADMFSFGITCYELMTRRKPFADHTLLPAPIPPLQVCPHMPPVLSSLILKCLEIDPNHRYPAMSVVVKDLHDLL